MSPDAVPALESVSRSFGARRPLDGVSLTVGRCEVALKAGRVAASGLDRARLIDIYGPRFEDAVHEEGR